MDDSYTREIARRMLQFDSQSNKHCICELPLGTLWVCKCFIVRSLETSIGDNWWHYNRNNVEVGAFRSKWVNLRRNVWLNGYVFSQHFSTFLHRYIGQILFYNIAAAKSCDIRKLYIRLLSMKTLVLLTKPAKWRFFRHGLGDLKVAYALHLWLIGNSTINFI